VPASWSASDLARENTAAESLPLHPEWVRVATALCTPLQRHSFCVINNPKSTSTFTGSTWPTSPNNPQNTTWTYNAATGLLASKTDAASQSVSYTYTQAGQLFTRTVARGTAATYTYSSTTGEMTGVSYSDGTPSVTYTYNRLGQIATVADVTGTRTLTHNLSGTLELQSETLPSGFYGDVKISRYYDTAAGKIGRYNSLAAGPAATPNYSIGYTYESTTGRMNNVWGFSYVYVPNSNLIQSTSASGWNYTDTRTYDAQHDWMSSRVTTITGATTPTKASFVYTPDAMGRITDVVKTGELFNRYGAAGTEGLKTTMGYNDRSELTSETTKKARFFPLSCLGGRMPMISTISATGRPTPITAPGIHGVPTALIK
jgi:YD repeat-containing protein